MTQILKWDSRCLKNMELFSDRCYFFIITSARKTLLWTAHRIKKKRQYICNSINTLFLGWCHGFTMFILCDTMMKHLPPVLVAPAWFLIKPRRSAALAVFTVEIDSGLFVYQKRKKKGKKKKLSDTPVRLKNTHAVCAAWTCLWSHAALKAICLPHP